MKKFMKMLPYLIVTMFGFYVLPLFGRDTGGFMVILLIAIPLICFIAALLYGSKFGFYLIYSIAVAVLFIPTIFIYYNSSAWIYIVVYAVIALFGSLLGGFIIYQKK